MREQGLLNRDNRDQDNGESRKGERGCYSGHKSSHRGRYNMDFREEEGDPYGNVQRARDHIRKLSEENREKTDC